MPLPPNQEELDRLSRRYGFNLSAEKLAEMSQIIAASFAVYDRLDEMADVNLPVRYPRSELGYRPVSDDNPLNGWAWKCSIKGASEGKLAGRTVALKDNISLAGVPMLNGTVLMEGFVPKEDATVVTRLLDAGAEIVGKTVTPAFCFDGGGFTTYPAPQPLNPHSPEHLPGASSGGSAVVVVNGEVDMAVGGDQGGSIRLPSAWSGCYGLKPTHGLVPYTGAFPIERTLDHLGPMARNVEDCAVMLEVIAGADGLDPRQIGVRTEDYTDALNPDLTGFRVGVLEEGFGISGLSEADVDQAVRDATQALAKSGATVESVSVPMHGDGLVLWSAIAYEGATECMVNGDSHGSNWRGHYATDMIDFFGRARRARGQDFPDTVKLTVLIGEYMRERYNYHYYAKAQNLSRGLAEAYNSVLSDFDVLVLPTTAMKPMLRPTGSDLGEYFGAALGNLYNTAPFDVTGHPAMSVPAGMSEGLPVGMMIVGKHFDDSTVLRVAFAHQEGAN